MKELSFFFVPVKRFESKAHDSFQITYLHDEFQKKLHDSQYPSGDCFYVPIRYFHKKYHCLNNIYISNVHPQDHQITCDKYL